MRVRWLLIVHRLVRSDAASQADICQATPSNCGDVLMLVGVPIPLDATMDNFAANVLGSTIVFTD